jgi:hypothetical protein
MEAWLRSSDVDRQIQSCKLVIGVLPRDTMSHQVVFVFRQKRSTSPFDFSVATPSGRRSGSFVGEWVLNNAGSYNVFVLVNDLFAEPNPLRSGNPVDFSVAQDGRQFARYRINGKGFAQALQFIAAETTRLKEAESQKKCGDCFFTTACCERIGLADDCFELMALRRFRDEGLVPLLGGEAEIAHYYDCAPKILAEMTRVGELDALIPLYLTHILPSAILARFGFYRLTHALYRDLMYRLEHRYSPR